MVSPPRDNSRIDTAMAENDSRAPTIQRTTRASLLVATDCDIGEGGETMAERAEWPGV